MPSYKIGQVVEFYSPSITLPLLILYLIFDKLFLAARLTMYSCVWEGEKSNLKIYIKDACGGWGFFLYEL